ncbi:MAG: cyclic nucleotide-binding domain-containing protein [Pirellulales bacterium]|nr:cyclic nucleotide-binding domain-containing protein [Pirellulales bacterium]
MRKVLFLLSQLSDSDLEWMVASGNKQTVPAGTVLIEEGRRIDDLYILLDGTLEISASQLGDQPFRLGCGEVVGEVSLLDSRPPTATVTAAVDSMVWAIPHDRLERRLDEDAGFAARFYHSLAVFLAHRLRNTYQRLGYGKERPMDEDQEYEDELSPELLDTVHLAGSRFDRALRQLLGR